MYRKFVILLCILIPETLAKQCLTPNKETAECISLYSCSVLISALARQGKGSIEFIKESNCGGTARNPLVCCGTSANFTVVKVSTNDQNKDSKIDLLPSNSYCGYQHADDYPRTENDTSIRITEFPWLVRIKSRNREENYTVYPCTGSLINRRYVLTAARCIHRTEDIVEAVQLGEFNTQNKTDCVMEPPFEQECSEPIEEVDILEAIPHPNYNSIYDINDIALIRLARNVKFSDYVRPICLPLPGRITAKVGDTVLSTGWGSHDFVDEYIVHRKKKLFSTIISNSECMETFRNTRVNITESHLCGIAFSNISETECQSDGGGPLMFSRLNQWQQEGILSFGVACGLGYPDVYANVKNYIEWILDVIQP